MVTIFQHIRDSLHEKSDFRTDYELLSNKTIKKGQSYPQSFNKTTTNKVIYTGFSISETLEKLEYKRLPW